MDGYSMGAAGWLEARAQQFTPPDGTPGIFDLATNNQSFTLMLINELKFAAAKSIRTSTIILASFNAIAAFATACGILYDSYTTRKRNNRGFRPSPRVGMSSFVKAADVYPLVLSFGISVQGVGFAVAQAQGLEEFLSRGCTLVSQFMLPAVFIVPYIQLVFGLEVALRGLRRHPFPPRAKFTITICLVVIGMLLLTNFLVADFIRSPDLCFASLFFFVAKYAQGSFVVLLVITIILLLCTILIFVRLSRSSKIETCERVAASRMVYYLALAVVSNTLTVPFFFALSFTMDGDQGGGQALTLSMVASVVANVSGLMTGGLQLFLRSNTISTIGPKDKGGDRGRRKRKQSRILRWGGPSDPEYGGHMMQPVSGALDLRRMLSDASLISSSYDKEEEATLVGRGSPTYDIPLPRRPNPLRSNAVYPMNMAAIRAPQPAQMSTASSSMRRTTSPYGAFPVAQTKSTESITVLPATTYTPGSAKGRFDVSTLKPPPSIKNLTVGRHRRDSSMASSATVQIGLRLSNVEDMPPLNTQVLDKKVYTIDGEEKDAPPPRRPSPLVNVDLPSGEDLPVLDDESPRRNPFKDARMKTLPPVPRPIGQPKSEEVEMEEETEEESEVDEGPTLSAAVYNPNPSPQSPTKTKLPSPRGVGFATPPSRSNSTAMRSPPPRRQTSSSGSPRAARGKAPGDWI